MDRRKCMYHVDHYTKGTFIRQYNQVRGGWGSNRVHHFPKIFELPLGHPTTSGFDIVEHVYEIFLNLNNFFNMHIAKENWIGDARRAARRRHCETIALSLV